MENLRSYTKPSINPGFPWSSSFIFNTSFGWQHKKWTSSPKHVTWVAHHWSSDLEARLIPFTLLFMFFFTTFSPLSPPPPSAATKVKNSSRFSPSTLAKQKLLNFSVPGPSKSIYKGEETNVFKSKFNIIFISIRTAYNLTTEPWVLTFLLHHNSEN